MQSPGFRTFQSTHPVWGATRKDWPFRPIFGPFQSTHPVWGATITLLVVGVHRPISIHAPRVGCDLAPANAIPLRRISIHAPRVGCDNGGVALCKAFVDFNPRTPCGVRLVQPLHVHRSRVDFNPRTPCGVRL